MGSRYFNVDGEDAFIAACDKQERETEIALQQELMMERTTKNFVNRFIVTGDDGHDFYPYEGRIPTLDEVREYMKNNMEDVFKNHIENADPNIAGSIANMRKAWNENEIYREKCTVAAYEYICDVSFENEG